jgi:hypothetical protein
MHLPPLGLVAVGLALRTIPFYRLEAPKAFDLFVAGINDVYLVATAVALVAVPLSLMIRKRQVVLEVSAEAS